MSKIDPLNVALQIREQLSSDKRKLAFFLGAGASMAVGLPGIFGLTEQVEERLEDPLKEKFKNIMVELKDEGNVEDLLNKIRIFKEFITDNNIGLEYAGLNSAAEVRKLDSAICKEICEIVCEEPEDLKPFNIFAQWIRSFYNSRDWPIEIFTTNYDLLIEKAMEKYEVPFFDGFVGAVNPFFVPQSVEAGTRKNDSSVYPPRAWTRLWKLHGSINWSHQKSNGRKTITRFSGTDDIGDKQLMIFPSREKYSQSRKLPFITFQDHFRNFLSEGEKLLIVIGYSFSDEHLNDVIFQSLRSNPRLAVTVFDYGIQEQETSKLVLSEKLKNYGEKYRNLSVYGPDKACVGGIVYSWEELNKEREFGEEEIDTNSFWDKEEDRFTLGDFESFASYLESFIGFKSEKLSNQSEIEEESFDDNEAIQEVKNEE